jgi:hypothetical protein
LQIEEDLISRLLWYARHSRILRSFAGPKQEMSGGKRRRTMTRNQRMVGSTLLLVALFASLFFAGTARAQAQSPAYVGKFTLTQQIHWGKTVLQPGKYKVTINSTVAPIIGTIRTADGDAVSFVISQASNENTNGVNALLISEKDGQPTVHSLALADLGVVLIYDPSLARERPQEARLSQTVPVMWAKK